MRCSSEEVRRVLVEDGLVPFASLLPKAEIDAINTRLDSHFEPLSHLPRSYCTAPRMAELGVLTRLLCEPILDLVETLEPRAKLYHCHVYEIGAGTDRSHIHGGPNMGWHWDTDVPYSNGTAGVPPFSLFLHLTHVTGVEDGAFEIAQGPVDVLREGIPTYVMGGPPGSGFLWSRRALHRANPNPGRVRRRVFKISVHHQLRFNRFAFSADFRRASRMTSIPDGIRKLFRLFPHAPADPTVSRQWELGAPVAESSVHLGDVEKIDARTRKRYRIA